MSKPRVSSKVAKSRTEQILELKEQGLSINATAKQLKCNRSTVIRALQKVKAEKAAHGPKRSDLPWHVLKSQNPWEVQESKELEMTRMECVQCGREMWTARPQDDLCEECLYIMMSEAAEESFKREMNYQASDPFNRENDRVPFQIPGDPLKL